MDDATLDARLGLARSIAREAGAQLRDAFGGPLTIETKSNALDLVTQADRAAEETILRRLADADPGTAVLAEESGARGDGTLRWLVDPLDGTTNFANGYPHYSVSIGLFDGDEGLLGVVYDPSRDELFSARRGGGAELERAGTARPVQIRGATRLQDMLLATGFAYDRTRAIANNVDKLERALQFARGIRRAGSAALDMAWVAAGRLDGYWEHQLSPWDWGAGTVLVREAGGAVWTLSGEPWAPGADTLVCGPRALLSDLLTGLLRE